MSKAILLKLDPALVENIDALRGDVPRTVWIKRACERVVELAIRQVTLGDPVLTSGSGEPRKLPEPRPGFKSRLKGEWKAP